MESYKLDGNILKKVCRICREEKPVDDFHKGRRDYRERGLPSGWHPDCKVCLIAKRASLRRIKYNNESKVCTKCGKKKSVGDFYKRGTNGDGFDAYQPWCIDCCRKDAKKKYKDDPDRQYYNMVRYRYGMNKSELLEMRAEQGEKCKICKSKLRKRANVDHCHKTGVVRGILCSKCNTGIGMFNDDPEIMLRAIEYINFHKKQ